MPFTAQHPEHGRLDATQPDLGCGVGWEDIHRARAPLSCAACEGRMVARTSVLGLRHFAHRRRTPDCPMAGESVGHLLLKSDLASAGRAAGWDVLLEAAAPHGAWRADVLAVSPDGLRYALEAQLSPITEDAVRERTERYAADGVDVCWFDDRERTRPWMAAVPSLHVTSPDGGPRTVRGVIARYSAGGGWQAVEAVALNEAVAWVLDGRLAQHEERIVYGPGEPWEAYRGRFWTAPHYAAAAQEESARRIAEREAEDVRRRQAQAAKEERAAAYERFWTRTGIGSAWWRSFEAIVRGALGHDTFFGTPSAAYGDGRPLYVKRDGGVRVVAVALPARLGEWVETAPVLVDDVPALHRVADLAFGDVKVFVASPVSESFECWWVRPGGVY
ncbi:competence protein CoiA family protein [Streptomyces sp. NPDC002057]|uniref:competence protein CoiA family protein n=1 Tax=Streptomyces sp. NPDC002057 TaxID=3154664 RepID=UPI00332466D1